MKRINYSKELLEEAIKNVFTYSDVCRKLGLYPNSGNIKTLHRIHKEKFDSVLHKLEEKFYYNMKTWKARAEDSWYGDPEEARKKGVKQGA